MELFRAEALASSVSDASEGCSRPRAPCRTRQPSSRAQRRGPHRTRDGYPCETFARLAELPIPLIASGGAGSVRHIADVLTLGRADAALAASIFHYNGIPIPVLKRELHRLNINVRQ